MSRPVILAVGGCYARAAGVRRDRSEKPVPVILDIEQTVDGVRRVITDRLASVVCPLKPGRWAVGHWAREASLHHPGMVLELEDIWQDRVRDEQTALTTLAEFLKYLYLQASRGVPGEKELFLVYQNATQRRWLERAVALSGLPVKGSGWISREDALARGLFYRGIPREGEGPVGVLDMGGSKCTLYMLRESDHLQWLGEDWHGSVKHISGLLAARLMPGIDPELARQGEVAVVNLLEEMVTLRQQLKDNSLHETIELCIPGATGVMVTPGTVWEILQSHLSPEVPSSPGAFVARCMEEAGVRFSRLVLVGGLAGLGFGTEFFPVPVVVPEEPWRVELEGAAMAASAHRYDENNLVINERGRWEKEKALLQDMCRKARQEAGQWRGAAAEREEQLRELKEQLVLKDRQIALLQEEVRELRDNLSDLYLGLEKNKTRGAKQREARGKGSSAARAVAGDDLSSELERLRKRNRQLEKRLRELKKQTG